MGLDNDGFCLDKNVGVFVFTRDTPDDFQLLRLYHVAPTWVSLQRQQTGGWRSVVLVS